MAAFDSPGMAQQVMSPRSSPAQPAIGGLLPNGMSSQDAAVGHPVVQAGQGVQSVHEAPGIGQSLPMRPEAVQSVQAGPDVGQSLPVRPEVVQSVQARPEATQSTLVEQAAGQSALVAALIAPGEHLLGRSTGGGSELVRRAAFAPSPFPGTVVYGYVDGQTGRVSSKDQSGGYGDAVGVDDACGAENNK